MSDDDRMRSVNATILLWHSRAVTLELEAFRAWSLTVLRAHLPFDGAIWGLLAGSGKTRKLSVEGAHLYRLSADVLQGFEQSHADLLTGTAGLERAFDVCLADTDEHGGAKADRRAHGRQHGIGNSVSLRFVDAHAAGQQFILLSRVAPAQRFSADEVNVFELLAPHMMQAYANCRKFFLDRLPVDHRRVPRVAAAIVDRGGVVHDHGAQFVPMLQHEWSDWRGERLPEPMLDVMARRGASRWSFLGQQVSAGFVPLDDLFLVTVRPRRPADVLTLREDEVAQRYAAGGNYREIAGSLQLSPATVRSHLRNVFGKLNVRNKSQLAACLR